MSRTLRSLFNGVCLLALLVAPGRAARYTRCPAGMVLNGGNCTYFALNIVDPKFTCESLLGKFGTMDCTQSSGHKCDEWAVIACNGPDSAVGPCRKLRKSGVPTKDLPEECRAYPFTILDPMNKPHGTLAAGAAAAFAGKKKLNFRQRLALEREIRRQALATDGSRLSVPDGDVSVDPKWMKCLARPEDGAWIRNGTYRVRRKDGWFEMAVSIYFRFRFSDPVDSAHPDLPKDRRVLYEVTDRVLRAEQCVEHFFARHQIKMDLQLNTNRNDLNAWWNSDISDITLWDSYPRSNSLNWGVIEDLGKPETEPMLCAMMVHEIGHRLGSPRGLPDEYQEPGADPNPEVVPDYEKSIMKHGDLIPLEDQMVIEKDLDRLLGPVCLSEIKPIPSPHPTPLPAP